MEIDIDAMWDVICRFVSGGLKRTRPAATLLLYVLLDVFMVVMTGVMIVMGRPAGVAVALVATVMAVWQTRQPFHVRERHQPKK